jgi:PPOX class probable F420-dependent enzyme
MSSNEFSNQEIRDFLDRDNPSMLGVLATLRHDGSPHAVPVWYRFDGCCVNIWSGSERNWVKNLIRDNRIAFSVQEERPPYAAVVVRGRGELLERVKEVDAEILRITRRYIPEPEVEDYIQKWAHLRLIIRIIPEKISSWGRGY